jgi:hypothetical protein
MRSASVSPSMNSITRKSTPSCWPTSNTADVRVAEGGDRSCLALEALPHLRIVGEVRREDLDGDSTVEARIVRAIHLAHPTRANRCGDFIGAEARSRSERHHFAGTSRFSSSNQLCTTWMACTPRAPRLVMRKRVPSGVTSYARVTGEL